MARNDGFSTPDDDLQAPPRPRATAARAAERVSAARTADEEEVDPRLLDLDIEEESPFLRAQKRVPVRRGPLPRKTADRLKIATIALLCAGVLGFVTYQAYSYAGHSWRFRIVSSDDIQVAGLQNVTRAQIMETFGGDLGRNVFFVPLAERQHQLERIPWVDSATVMRLLPHQLRVQIKERTPVAFAQVGSRIQLLDANGVLMDLPRVQKKYSFPVLVGMAESEPLSTRAARMAIYARVVQELDSDGSHSSQDISEMDVTDPPDVKITVADDDGAVLVHLGDSDFLQRFRIYKSHVQEWRQKFQKIESVDLRYYPQVIVNPDKSAALPAASSPAPTHVFTPAGAPLTKHAAVGPRKFAAAKPVVVHKPLPPVRRPTAAPVAPRAPALSAERAIGSTNQ